MNRKSDQQKDAQVGKRSGHIESMGQLAGRSFPRGTQISLKMNVPHQIGQNEDLSQDQIRPMIDQTMNGSHD
jgi:hypothetical protein